MDKTNDAPLISVIVPVYNVEPYLRRCIDSILNQTYQTLEILLVDDGSPDGCPQICDGYAELDGRVRVIHKPNGGLSSARNAGIAQAAGEWIGFVDSDDYIAPKMYEKLYDAVKQNDADLAICDYVFVDNAGKETQTDCTSIGYEVLTKREAFNKLNILGPNRKSSVKYITAVNKLYRRSIFDGCLFKECVLHEDEFFVHRMLECCTTVAVVGEVLYYYVQRDGSITHSAFSVRRLDADRAFLDRHYYFLERDCPDLAYSALYQAYAHLLSFVLKNTDAIKFRREIAPLVKEVTRELIRGGNLRAVKLIIGYLRFLCKGVAGAWRKNEGVV